jgi:hypothetical protein
LRFFTKCQRNLLTLDRPLSWRWTKLFSSNIWYKINNLNSLASKTTEILTPDTGRLHSIWRLTFQPLPVTLCTNSLTFNNWTLCPHTVFRFFCIYLRTNSDLCHLQHKLIGFYNLDDKCLLHGTNWDFNPYTANVDKMAGSCQC